MSFAKEIKDELSKIKCEEDCKKAELSAFLQMNTEIVLNSEGPHLSFQTMNNSVARRFISLVREFYSIEIDLLTKKQNLKKEDIYYVNINNAKQIIDDQELLNYDYSSKSKYIIDEDCKKSYLRGVFLTGGSVNDPNNSYHLEIKAHNDKDAIFIQSLMNAFDLNAKITRRRNELIVYIKEAQKILDCLYLIGATRMYFKYEEIRVTRDINNQVNRKVNCEIANEEKTVVAANQQLKDISKLEALFSINKIDPKLKEVMELRKKNPVASFQELRELYATEYGKTITKSGLNHRFRRIHELASQD